MFAMYRPRQAGCTFASGDAVSFTANVSPSSEATQGKYPEYHRVWADNALNVVMLFSHEYPDPTPGDEGVTAYQTFVTKMTKYMAQVQPDASKRIDPAAPGPTNTHISAELPDGRTMAVEARLVASSLDAEGADFDTWYDGLTPSADLILYNGHAGLGSNVRTLMTKGTFRAGQYLIWFANGCDTLAYVDRTLVDRRAQLNPDDPHGTKYTDVVTNVMAGYFDALEATALTFVKAFVEVRYPELGPKTYEQIFAKIDPYQVAVVTGEEDNELQPLPPAPRPPGPPPVDDNTNPSDGKTAPLQTNQRDPATTPADTGGSHSHGCGIGARRSGPDRVLPIGLLAVALAARRRRRVSVTVR
jgi:hypothetical protein